MPQNQLKPNQIRDNYVRLQGRVGAAAARSGRKPEQIRIVGVTKYVDEAATRALAEAGCRDLGESRPQSLWGKSAALADLDVRWHLIGHLQRNKSRRTFPLLRLMHSLDSERIYETLALDAAALGQSLDVLLEINVTTDESKTGFSIDNARTFLAKVASGNLAGALIANAENNAEASVADVNVTKENGSVRIVGLMGMSSLEGGDAQAHVDFAKLREIRDEWQVEFGMQLPELSMGMSNDFEIAIEHGATIIRVGSMLFEAN